MPPSLKTNLFLLQIEIFITGQFESKNFLYPQRSNKDYVDLRKKKRICEPAQKAMCSPSASLPFSWAVKDLIISRCDYRNWSLYSTNRLHANSKCCRKVFKYSPAPGKIPKTSGFPKLCFCRHLYLHQLTSSCESFGVVLFSEQLKFVC